MYWLYWEETDGKKSNNVNILIDIFKKKLDKLNIISEKNIGDYINVINADHLCIAEKVDYYRGKLLYTYGGIWLDIDTILINNIDYLYNNLLNSDKEVCVSTSELDNNVVCLQYLISKPKSKIFELWYKKMEEMIINKEKFKYSYFGTVLANVIKKK